MKTLPFILLFALTTLLCAHDDYRQGYRDGYRDAEYRTPRIHYVDVVSSTPIYEEVVTYRSCRRMDHGDAYASHHEGALIGGGIVGHHLDTRHPLHTTVGGAVAGAIIGSKLAEAQERHLHTQQCKVVETRLSGYRNIAYWRGKTIVEISDRPLRRIRVHGPRQRRR